MVRTRTRSPTAGGDALAHRDDPSAHVGTLDARERQRLSRPGRVRPSMSANSPPPPRPVPEEIDFEYQPMRVLMSVLLTPGAGPG